MNAGELAAVLEKSGDGRDSQDFSISSSTDITFVGPHATPLATSGLHPRSCPPCWETPLHTHGLNDLRSPSSPCSLFLAYSTSLSVPHLIFSHTHPPVSMEIPAVALVTLPMTCSAWVLINTFSFEMIFLRVPFPIFLNFDYLPDFSTFAYSLASVLSFLPALPLGPSDSSTTPH